jgi:epsilon-lactone hydrolase
MSACAPSLAKTTQHSEHLADRAAMLAMRTMIGLQPPADLGPAGRTAFDELMTKTPSVEGVTYEATVVGGVAGWWCHPADAVTGGAILYLHGGAYVVGSAQAYRHFAGQIASRARAPAFVADYGLAPERPFPAAVDDAEAAYRGLIAAGFSGIAIVGDSAGGGLALVTAARMIQAARDGVTPSPVAACVMSPWTDLALTGESIESRAKHDPLLTRGALEIARRHYLGQEDAKDPRASPLYGDLADLPVSNFTSARTRSCSTTRGDTPICWRNPAQRPNCTSGWAWCMSSPPTSPSCTAREAPDVAGAFLRRNLAHCKVSHPVRSPPLEWRSHMTRILFVGQKPETVDFSDPSLPPGFNAEKINAGITLGVAKIEERGWQGDTCMITPDAAGNAMLETALKAAAYDCVVIGGGLRLPPKSLTLFETVVNIIHKTAPNAAIAFNTSPEDTAESAARQLHA